MITSTDLLLAGDIGGTKTHLAIFSTETDLREPLAEEKFSSINYDGLEPIVDEFLKQSGMRPQRASFGVAGPVVEGVATITNLPWVIRRETLARTFGFSKVYLLNDLVAIANAIPLLQPDELYTLNAGDAVDEGAIAVVAPGTGLGEAYLTWDGVHYRPFASEGGHVDFAPTTEMELDMLRYLRTRYRHVSYERVCSGKGLPNIYDFLKDSNFAPEPDWLAQALAATQDRTPVIIGAATDNENPCELAATALKMFVSILGTEAGNMALKVLASGGVYLGGGIPPRILPSLSDGVFMEAFLRKGRFSEFLNQVPVYVILYPKVALLGAAGYGLP